MKNSGVQTHHYTLDGVRLECEIEWERGECETSCEPGYPDNAVLVSAKVDGVDISIILSDAQREEIETAFLNQPEESL